MSKILNASYQKLEQVENGKIHAGLNNDTETISSLTGMIIGGLTNSITLICCFIYLGIINFYGLIASVIIILITAGLYFYISISARALWERNRDIQNKFFGYIHSLVDGFKELYSHRRKRDEFENDMRSSCEEYRDKNIEGEVKFINVYIIGELLFIGVIASVAFVFPVLFPEMNADSLRTYIFVFLYMTGPVHGLLNVIPGVTRFRISWKRINDLINEISIIQNPHQSKEIDVDSDMKLSIQLKNAVFKYNTGEEDKYGQFVVGPVDCEFNSGEITFITGGNGSGKTTLARLITGLYTLDEGYISLNGREISPQDLSQYFSAVMSDFYLFNKLYGIDYANKQEEMMEYLKLLHIDNKININDGIFSTTKLSTGQRKRLALFVSYLENRPVYLFDEWAADQDPEFRNYFYLKLLPELKRRGKCVVAITHDDRYFNLADKVIKMEAGKILKVEAQSPNDSLNLVTAR